MLLSGCRNAIRGVILVLSIAGSPAVLLADDTVGFDKIEAKNIKVEGSSASVLASSLMKKMVVKDLKETRKKAEQGDPEAQNKLGIAYLKGQGVRKNDRQAVRWFKTAAEQGYAQAQHNLALMYEIGQEVKKDSEKSKALYADAAAQGHAEAMYRLAYSYKRADSVDQYLQWLLKSSDHGYPLASNDLGAAYAQGKIVPKDDKRAFSLLLMAANGGLARAMYNVSVFYRDGRGVNADVENADLWLNKAAENNDSKSQYVLGIHKISQGKYKDAFRWIKSSAERGFPVAQFKMGAIYLNENDNKKAFYWFVRSANSGNQQAKELLQTAGQLILEKNKKEI